jgi:hypothetical protein
VVYTNTEFSVTKRAGRFSLLDNGFSIMGATSVCWVLNYRCSNTVLRFDVLNGGFSFMSSELRVLITHGMLFLEHSSRPWLFQAQILKCGVLGLGCLCSQGGPSQILDRQCSIRLSHSLVHSPGLSTRRAQSGFLSAACSPWCTQPAAVDDMAHSISHAQSWIVWHRASTAYPGLRALNQV